MALLLIDVVPSRPRNLVSLVGLLGMLLLATALCKAPEKISWHTVFWGLALQFWMAAAFRRTQVGTDVFQWTAKRMLEFLAHADAGSKFIFGSSYLDHRLAFQLMPTVVVFSVAVHCLYHLGVVQTLIARLGQGLSLALGTSPLESVNAVTNMLVSTVQATILIQPFLAEMTQSELFAVLTGGFASIAGAFFGAFVAFGAPADHLLVASVMSAPAALAFAKLIRPQERPSPVTASVAAQANMGIEGGLLGAINQGANVGFRTLVQVMLSLLVYVAMLHWMDATFLWMALRGGFRHLDLSRSLAYVLYPLTYSLGFEAQDCLAAGRLLTVKLLTTTQMSYIELGSLIKNQETLQAYIATNGSWSYVNGFDIHLNDTNTTLLGGVLSTRSSALSTYMLCGFSNVGSLGVAVSAIAALEPKRRLDIMRLAPLALLAGNMACLSTTCVAGLLIL